MCRIYAVPLENKSLTIDERNLTSTQWIEYHIGTKRKSYNTLSTSNITAEAVTVDGFTLSQTDNAGVTTTNGRSYTASGMIQIRTDGRGNTTTTVTDKAGRMLTATDTAGNVTTTAYDSAHDLTAMVTDAQGNTSCYRYDVCGRKLAEWGTGIQPVCFGYDDADRMTSLTTFRAGTETVSTDPSNRTDGDTTTWTYHDASGMETSKTYADNTSVVKTYDAYNRVLTETDARGKVKAHTYEPARGLLLGTTYSDSTSHRTYTYNHLGQPTQVTDAAGVRTLSYNAYGEQESDSLVADSVTHLITETRDDKGRSTGYTYAKNGSVQQTVTTGYGSDGRIASAGFLHGGAAKQFSYEYLAGTHLLEKLTKPNGMTLTQSYEIQRDLLTGMAYHRGTTLVANRQYSYDTLGRPTARNTSRQGTVKNDTFGYNNRSELTSATVNGSNYAYDYDNIGNRAAAVEDSSGVASRTEYTANELNQYTAVGDFTLTFDADGNQTLVKTTTGIWSITYDAENRPVSFTSTEPNTVIEIAYDHMGRRATKKVTVDGEVTLHQRYLYRGYLQIACCDLTRSAHPCLWLITWDPTQPIATRPLAIQKDATWYTYGWDLTKNICELYGTNGYIRTAYSYTPYGEVTESSNSVYQPIQWSSEYNDTELGLVYYNYRHYNPTDGRWLGRDKELPTEYNLYVYCRNDALTRTDKYGLYSYANRASTTRTETYDKNGYYETANGKANTKFPDGGNIYYEKNGMKCVKTIDVAYVGEITLFKSWDLSKDYRYAYYFDREYKTVLEHEYHHVDITINNWNIFVNTSKMFEGCYCSKECALLAGGLIDIYKRSYQNNTHLENAYFDMSEYGEKLPDEHDIKKDLLKTISDSIEASDKIEEFINNSLIKFNNCI